MPPLVYICQHICDNAIINQKSNTINYYKDTKNDEMYKSLSLNIADAQKISAKIYEHTQVVYGNVEGKVLKKIESDCDDIEKVIELYSATQTDLTNLELDSNVAVLIYPMVSIEVSDNHRQSFMKCKTIDSDTGQLHMHWVLVFEKKNDVEQRYISKFSLVS